MSSQFPDEPGLSFRDLLADPMVRLIMQADGIDEREVREIFERAAADIKGQRETALSSQAQDGPTPAETEVFRRGVGIMLVNPVGHIFVGQRIDMTNDAWQMPQGGIEQGETPRSAAFRELREEIGTSNAEVVIATEDWLSYELPVELLDRMPTARRKGQAQKWFLMRFRGHDTDVNVLTEHPEFSKWKWVPADHLIELIVPFKRELYKRVLREFTPHFLKARSTTGES